MLERDYILGRDYITVRNADIPPHPQQSLAEAVAVNYLQLVKERGIGYVEGVIFGVKGEAADFHWCLLALTSGDLLVENPDAFLKFIGIEADIYNNPDFSSLQIGLHIECPLRVGRSPVEIFEQLEPTGGKWTTIISFTSSPTHSSPT